MFSYLREIIMPGYGYFLKNFNEATKIRESQDESKSSTVLDEQIRSLLTTDTIRPKALPIPYLINSVKSFFDQIKAIQDEKQIPSSLRNDAIGFLSDLINKLQQLHIFLADKYNEKISEKKEAMINSISQKLVKIYNDSLLMSVKIGNIRCEDILYPISISLAKMSPRNENDPFTQEPPRGEIFFTSDRYQFELSSLITWVQALHKYINPKTKQNETSNFVNPLTGLPFSPVEIDHIIKKVNDIIPEFKLGVSSPHAEYSQLDIDAIAGLDPIAAARLQQDLDRKNHPPVDRPQMRQPLSEQASQVELKNFMNQFQDIEEAIHFFRPEVGGLLFYKPDRDNKADEKQNIVNIMARLNRSNILHENQDWVNAKKLFHKQLNIGTDTLNYFNILNQATFDVLKHDPINSIYLGNIMNKLHQARIELDRATLDVLKNNSNKSEAIWRELDGSSTPLTQEQFLRIIENSRPIFRRFE